MPQERPVHGRAHGVGGVGGEQHVAAVVALVEGGQHEGRVVGPVAVGPHGAEPRPRRRAGHGDAGLQGRGDDLGPRRVGAPARRCCRGRGGREEGQQERARAQEGGVVSHGFLCCVGWVGGWGWWCRRVDEQAGLGCARDT